MEMDVTCEMIDLLANYFVMSRDLITRESEIGNDCGGDSLDVIDLDIAIRERFNLRASCDFINEKVTVGQIIDWVEKTRAAESQTVA